MPAVKSNDTTYRTFRVPGGWSAAARSRNGICAFVLRAETREAAESEIRKRCPGARASPAGFRTLAAAVRRYYHGWRTSFDDLRLDLSAGTPFQQRVWTLARRIPYGQVRSYNWIGMEIGRPHAARAVGNAVGANPVPLIIPCHRVLSADGALGGFSAPGGPDVKARMLQLERVPVHGTGPKRRVQATGWSKS